MELYNNEQTPFCKKYENIVKYTEYLAQNLDKIIQYSEYLAEKLSICIENNIKLTEKIVELEERLEKENK